jgi:hypothetical protein
VTDPSPLISREEVVEALENAVSHCDEEGCDWNNGIEQAIEMIRDLPAPPVSPQPVLSAAEIDAIIRTRLNAFLLNADPPFTGWERLVAHEAMCLLRDAILEHLSERKEENGPE